MGRAEGFRLQAGFGVHLHRGCLATSRGCLATRSGGVRPQVVHTQVPAEACPSPSRTTSTLLRELQFSHLDNHLYSLSYGPTCAPIPRQVVPQPRTRACTHCPICAQFPTETPTPRPGPSPTSHPHPDPSPLLRFL